MCEPPLLPVAKAALLVRKEIFDIVGVFDEQFFVYFEEVDLCLRVKRRGYRIVYFPGASIVHLQGKSSQQNIPVSSKYLWESKMKYLRKYYSKREIDWFVKYFTGLLMFKKFIYMRPKDQLYDQIVKTLYEFSGK